MHNISLQEEFDRKMYLNYLFDKIEEAKKADDGNLELFSDEIYQENSDYRDRLTYTGEKGDTLSISHIYVDRFNPADCKSSFNDILATKFLCVAIDYTLHCVGNDKDFLDSIFDDYLFQVHDFPKFTSPVEKTKLEKFACDGQHRRVVVNIFKLDKQSKKVICLSQSELDSFLHNAFHSQFNIKTVKQLHLFDDGTPDTSDGETDEEELAIEYTERNIDRISFRLSKGGQRTLWKVVPDRAIYEDPRRTPWRLEKVDVAFNKNKYNTGVFFEGIVAAELRNRLNKPEKPFSITDLSNICPCPESAPIYLNYAKNCVDAIYESMGDLLENSKWTVVHKYLSKNYDLGASVADDACIPGATKKVTYNNIDTLWTFVDPSDIYLYRIKTNTDKDNPFIGNNSVDIIHNLKTSIANKDLINISIKGNHGLVYDCMPIVNGSSIHIEGDLILTNDVINDKRKNTTQPLIIENFSISNNMYYMDDAENNKIPNKFILRVTKDYVESTLSGRSYQLGKAQSLFNFDEKKELSNKTIEVYKFLRSLLKQNDKTIDDEDSTYRRIEIHFDSDKYPAMAFFLRNVLKIGGLDHYIVFSTSDDKSVK